jgi:hypothetical protein
MLDPIILSSITAAVSVLDNPRVKIFSTGSGF